MTGSLRQSKDKDSMSDEIKIDYKELTDRLLSGITLKTVSSTPTTTYGHGPGGLFSAPGLAQPLFSAMTLPVMGLQDALPAYPSRDANPLYGIVTGQTATTGDEPTGVCDDPPTVGLTKLCQTSVPFGRQSRQSRVYDVDRTGLLNNRSDMTDLRLMNNPFNQVSNTNVPTLPGNPAQMAQNEFAKAMFEFAVGWKRDFARELYTGNPTNNTAGGGRKYYYGLDLLINTGYRDAESGVACPAADSIVRSFGSLDVASNGTTVVRTITNIYRNLKYIASKAGLNPVKWGIAMSWALFYELTEVWPIAYHTYRNVITTSPATQTLFNDGRAISEMRDAMRGNIDDMSGQYLLIDGEKVMVILDEAITETVLAGESFTSTIYFVPLTVLGGTVVTYIEYFDQGLSYEFAQQFAPGFYQVTDGGRFLIHKKPPTNFCVQLLGKTEPRVVLRTPFLAGRLTSVKYTPVAHQRDSFTDSSYFVNGGGTSRDGVFRSFYTPTA